MPAPQPPHPKRRRIQLNKKTANKADTAQQKATDTGDDPDIEMSESRRASMAAEAATALQIGLANDPELNALFEEHGVE